MFQPNSMGEDCLHANVHVPATVLPNNSSQCSASACLPVVVFIHGGGFTTGSGDSDMYGPEYMMDQNIVLITFNYRLGPFGFLSLNTSTVPGNAGLRDMVAALQWVQANARAFGGDPARVTLMGQSTGACSAHMLSLSDTTRGLYNKVILMSGTAGSGFLSTTPKYSQYALELFLEYLNITSTDVEEIHDQLLSLPYETLVEANRELIDDLGFVGFSPVVESHFDGVSRILSDDPDTLVANGKGNNYPLLIGFTNVECEALRRRLEFLDIVSRIEEDATAVLPVKLSFEISDEAQEIAAERLIQKYFPDTITVENYITSYCTTSYQYPPIKLAQARATAGAPVFLYQFSYNSDFVPLKKALRLKYTGGAHLDDLFYIYRVNSILGNTTLNRSDESVKNWLIDAVINFVHCSAPLCSGPLSEWPAVSRPLLYQDIQRDAYSMAPLSPQQRDMIQFLDNLYQL